MPCGDALCGDGEISYHGEELGYGITVRYQQHSRVSARGNTCDQQAFERRSPALARVVEVTTLPCGIHGEEPFLSFSAIAEKEENTAGPKQSQ